MQESWRAFLSVDPLPVLQKTANPAVQYFIQRDLLDQNPGPVEQLWTLPEVVRILKKQLSSGAWPDPRYKTHLNSPTNYLVLETYRNLGILIELYGLNNIHPQIRQAADYLFLTQTAEGDFRGIYGTQYSSNYCAGILELLVKVGYVEDDRIHRAFRWFLSHQQNGGGWTLPMQAHGVKLYESEEVMRRPEIYPFEPTKPFSHSLTGIILRAFAAHPRYRGHPDPRKAAELIKHRFFKADKYSFLYIPCYGFFGALCVLLISRKLEGKLQEIGIVMALTFFIAGLFDALENINLLLMINSPTSFWVYNPFLASLFASFKIGSLGAGLGFLYIVSMVVVSKRISLRPLYLCLILNGGGLALIGLLVVWNLFVCLLIGIIYFIMLFLLGWLVKLVSNKGLN